MVQVWCSVKSVVKTCDVCCQSETSSRSRRTFLKRPPFGAQSWGDFEWWHWLSVRSWVQLVGFQPAGCWRPLPVLAGTWTWTRRAARPHTNLWTHRWKEFDGGLMSVHEADVQTKIKCIEGARNRFYFNYRLSFRMQDYCTKTSKLMESAKDTCSTQIQNMASLLTATFRRVKEWR